MQMHRYLYNLLSDLQKLQARKLEVHNDDGGGMDEPKLYNCSYLLLGDEALYLNRSSLVEALTHILVREPWQRRALQACLWPDERAQPLALPGWQKLAWACIFAAMLLVAITGNAVVIWIVLAHRRMRTVTNYFLVNLSVADLLMSVMNCTFNFVSMVESHWPFGQVYCTVNNFVSNVSVAASVFTLVSITIDRYMAICKPLRHRMSRRKAWFALLAVWSTSGALALPPLLYSTTATDRYSDGKERTRCFMLWPDGNYPDSMSEHLYNILFLGVTYVVPVIAMSLCYWAMGRQLWGSKSIGERTQRQIDYINSKRKVVRMFVTVMTIFAVCWLPYHAYFIYVYHNASLAVSSYVQQLYLAFYWLAMSNAMVNPVIYYWMNARFRLYFRQIMCMRCGERSTRNTTEDPTRQSNHVLSSKSFDKRVSKSRCLPFGRSRI